MFKKIALATALIAASTVGAMALDTGWTTAGLNVRSGPSTEYDSLAKVGKCEKLDVYEEVDNWYRIEWNGQWGWISAKYLAASDDHCHYVAPTHDEPTYDKPAEEPAYEEPVYEKPKPETNGY